MRNTDKNQKQEQLTLKGKKEHKLQYNKATEPNENKLKIE